MKLRHKILTATFLILVFLILPVFGTGAMWIRHVGLLPDTAVVFSADSAAMDRFMASALKPYYGDRIGICNGVNDHVEIQAALDAVRDVKLSVGEFNCEVTVDIDNSYQTLRGCDRNTILTTSTANLDFITATGGAGTELVGILIADLCVDGAGTGDDAILWTYVDDSKIMNVWFIDNDDAGVEFSYCDHNEVIGCHYDTCGYGVYIANSSYNVFSDSIFDCVVIYAHYLSASHYNTIGNNVVHYWTGYLAYLLNSDYNTIADNVAHECGDDGIYLQTSDFNSISGNTIHAPQTTGIRIYTSVKNTIVGNTIENAGSTGIWVYQGSDSNAIGINTITNSDSYGIFVYYSDYCSVIGNICTLSGYEGIMVEGGDHSNISDNVCTESSQSWDDSYSNIQLTDTDYSLVDGNTCRQGAQANQPEYGITVADGGCDGNIIQGNDLHDAGKTANFNDAGTDTRLNVYVVPFSNGDDPQFSGFQIDAAAELARGWLRLPAEVVQVVRIKVYGVALDAEADKMRAEFTINGGASDEAANTHIGSVANHPSTTSNFAAIDVIYWTITTAGVLDLVGGDSVVVEVVYEDAGGGDCATNAVFRTVEIEYV